MPQSISVTEAVRSFSDIINRVHYQGQSYLLTRGGTIVALLTPSPPVVTGVEFARRWVARPRLAPEDAASWEEELAGLKAAEQPPQEASWDS